MRCGAASAKDTAPSVRGVSARPDLGLVGRDGGGQAQFLAGGDRLVRVQAGEGRVVGDVERVGVGGVRGLLPVRGRLRQLVAELADLRALDVLQAASLRVSLAAVSES
ncbi:hypothetical protein GCM10027074_40800 [Streptomyces deserti]